MSKNPDAMSSAMWCPSFQYKPARMLLKGAVSEREINKQPHHNSLKAAIAEALPSINTHYLIEDAAGYRSQIQSIIEAEDGFIQYEK